MWDEVRTPPGAQHSDSPKAITARQLQALVRRQPLHFQLAEHTEVSEERANPQGDKHRRDNNGEPTRPVNPGLEHAQIRIGRADTDLHYLSLAVPSDDPLSPRAERHADSAAERDSITHVLGVTYTIVVPDFRRECDRLPPAVRHDACFLDLSVDLRPVLAVYCASECSKTAHRHDRSDGRRGDVEVETSI